MIAEFRGPYAFLSNFHPVEVFFDEWDYPTVENAYQAAKTLDPKHRRICRVVKPSEAKRLGGQVELREDWEAVKISIMLDLLRQKFSATNRELSTQLLATGAEWLLEGNSWGDTFWGVDRRTGLGENHLGRLLMQVRKELRDGTDQATAR